MKKVLLSILVILILVSTGCSTSKEDQFKIGATQVPHSEILEFIKPILAEKGVNIKIIPYNDYVQPNLNLHDGDIDANYFQHLPYLTRFNQDNGTKLVPVVPVHLEPMAIYSKKITDLKEFQGGKVGVPNDVTNLGRALALLESAGIIKLADGVGVRGTVGDIVENPLNIEIVELDAALIANMLPDLEIGIINTNYALLANLNPVKDGLFIEEVIGNPYANILVVKEGMENDERVKIIAEVLNSQEVRDFILEKYKGSVLPAF
ncbi:MetQ/NlpA family ABC transporter substrate-binding protein [Anaerobranca gottschalkii]|uniref:D-methionine transport system substrate-binding protein n=1 Tax=Anaerobranca gottschalkii DSM 13577 TaxID=1120990 RepID=A0A1I0CKQ5_9FIRM|nr:MetQ/NlpA family ABC transporter substrate-binding protein [Anaerobranca gottschalkii]SET20210.1 D-methionine transport system substrate-binding protein [Anaerobranca gottschalkii DSM 13577]